MSAVRRLLAAVAGRVSRRRRTGTTDAFLLEGIEADDLAG